MALFFVNFHNFSILRSMEWPAPDYQKSLVFINETRKKFPGSSPHG